MILLNMLVIFMIQLGEMFLYFIEFISIIAVISIPILLFRIDKTLNEILTFLKPISEVKSVKFFLIKNGQKEELKKMKVSGEQELEVMAEYTDKFGNVAPVEAASIEVTDPSLASVELAEGGKSAKAKVIGKIGFFKFKAKADGKMGEGEKLIELESEEIEVVAGEAEKGVIQVKLVEVQPEQPSEPQP